MSVWPGVSTRRESARYPMRPGKAICTLSACCSSTAPIRILRRMRLPTAWRCSGPVAAITWTSPSCCWSTAPIPTPALDSSGCCLTIGEVYHGDQAKPLQQLLRRHGAYTPPYHMSVQEMKQAIRDGHEVIRHEEFLEQCDADSATSNCSISILTRTLPLPGSLERRYLSEVARIGPQAAGSRT